VIEFLSGCQREAINDLLRAAVGGIETLGIPSRVINALPYLALTASPISNFTGELSPHQPVCDHGGELQQLHMLASRYRERSVRQMLVLCAIPHNALFETEYSRKPII
jgi:hypothetical protein